MKTKEEIEKINNLEGLFDAWNEDQKNECNTSCEDTFPEGVGVKDNANYKANFCPDGFLNDNEEAEILFICRESNTDGKYKEKNPFWMKEVVNKKSKNPSEYYCDDEFEKLDNDNKKRLAKRTQTKYFNCLLALSNDGDAENKNTDNIQKCAYVNINKRGGMSSCNQTLLENYYKKYEDYILKEIKIIDPDKIVILGDLRERIKEGLTSCGKPIYLYPFHPCVYRKSALKSLEEL